VRTDPQPWWRNLIRWVLCLAGIAVVLAVAALVRTAPPAAQWGTVADWSAAVGSILAAVVAVGIAMHTNDRQIEKENAEVQNAKDRARRKADRVEVSTTRTGTAGEYEAAVKNLGVDDIYEVSWFFPIMVDFRDRKFESAKWAQSVGIGEHRNPLRFRLPEVLGRQERSRIYFECEPHPDENENNPATFKRTPFPLVSFVDMDGYRLGRVYKRLAEDTEDAKHDRIWGDWEVVDDDYPSNVNGVLREMIDSAGDPMPPVGPRGRDLN
jgi:uncharacterized membrane protein